MRKAVLATIGVCCGIAAGSFAGFRFARERGEPESNASTAGEAQRFSGTTSSSSAVIDTELKNPVAQRLFSALHDPLEMRRTARIYGAVQELQAADFPAVMAAFEKLPQEFHFPLIRMLVRRWMAVNPEAAQAWTLAHPRFSGWAVSEWVATDPEGALRAGADPAFRAISETLIRQACYRLSESQFATSWELLKKLPAGSVREIAMRDALGALGRTNPTKALTLANEIASGTERARAKANIMEEWSKREPRKALAFLSETIADFPAGVLGNSTVTEVIAKVAAEDASAAIAAIETLPPEFRSAAGIAAARQWAEKDPVAALDWCVANGIELTRGDRKSFNMWRSSVLGEAMLKHPGKTVSWVEAFPPGAQRDQLAERALSDALWLFSQPQRMQGDPPYVFRLLGQLPSDAQERVAANMGKAAIESGSIPDLAQWAEAFPGSSARQNAIAGALQSAYQEDASQVDSLLASLKSANDRDAALQGLAAAMDDQQPADAASKALAISNEGMRRQTLEEVVVPWLKSDPTRSRAWLENEGGAIPAEWRQSWLGATESAGR